MLSFGFLILVLVILFSLVFDFVNGINDSANVIATCISTRAISIRAAILMTSVMNLAGALISTKVATTIGMGIVDPKIVTQAVVLAGILGAISWGLVTWSFAIPSSSSHAIIGGLIGAVVAHCGGFGCLHFAGISKIILALILTPFVGVFFGFFSIVVFLWIFRQQSPSVINNKFKNLQIISAAVMALSHGTADAQKSMGVITIALASYGALHSFQVPLWVMISCAVAMALGTAIGGVRMIKTVGIKFVKMQPIHGFTAQFASAVIILSAAAFGLPTSTSHVITSSILGIGLSRRITAINWKVAYKIALVLFITIPITFVIGFSIYKLGKLIFFAF